MEYTIAVLVAIVIGATQVAKIAGLAKRWLPTFAVVIGVAISVIHTGLTGNAVLEGLMVSLMSMGLYSASKTTVK
jgi:hypothetical protein